MRNGIVACIGVLSVVGAGLILHHLGSGCDFDSQNSSMEDLIPRKPPQLHNVDRYIRKLPQGYHASVEKMASATENGFDSLKDGYTWVKSHARGS